MPNGWQCPDDPSLLWELTFCLSALSKDLRGEMGLRDRRENLCAKPHCVTLTTMHELRMEVVAHPPCDDPQWGKPFDGMLSVRNLVTVFDQDGMHRGLHAGDFQWLGNGVEVVGRMSGMTNVGVHRDPIFDPCQRCDERGVMEGRLCGSVVNAQYPELQDSQVLGVYLIRFDPSPGFGGSSLKATFEGVVVRRCVEVA